MSNIITDGLIGYWHYKRGIRGNTWYNIAPNTKGQYNATIHGNPIFTDKGLYLNGESDFIEVSGLQNASNYPTIEIGFIHDAEGEHNPLVNSKNDDTNFVSGLNIQHATSGANPSEYRLFITAGGTTFNTSYTLNKDTQYQLSVFKESYDTFIIVRNRSSNYYKTLGNNYSFTFDDTLYIGRDVQYTNRYFKGYIQYVRVYDRTLSIDEISNNQEIGVDNVGLPIHEVIDATEVPVAPTGFKEITVHPLYSTLKWDYDVNASEYILKRNGEVIYQGGDTYFKDEALIQQTDYSYELTSINNVGVSEVSVVQIRTPILTAKDLPIGAKIKMGRQEFAGKRVDGTEDIIWEVVSQNHWKKDENYPKNATTLITEKVINYLQPDAEEFIPKGIGYDTEEGKIGINVKYFESNIRQWLNSDAEAGQWFKQKNKYDTKPSIDNLTPAKPNYYNFPYDQDTGFMRYFSNVEKSLLETTDITVATNDRYINEDKVWMTDYFYLPGAQELLSGFDLPLEEPNPDGHYFDNLRKTTSATDLAWANFSTNTQPSTGALFITRTSGLPYNYTDKYGYEQSVSGWLVYNPNPSDKYRFVSYSTYMETYGGAVGIRPMCNITHDAILREILDEQGNKTGIYEIWQDESQYRTKYPSVTTAKNVPLNTIIKMGRNKFEGKRVNGSEEIFWRVVSKNHWKKDRFYPQNAVTLMSERILRYMAFSPIDEENGYRYGNNVYMWSSLAEWLNSSGLNGEWFTPSTMSPNPPDYNHILHDKGLNQPYDKDDGFLSFFTETEKNAMLTTRVAFHMLGVGSEYGQTQLVHQKVFLPSYVEATGVELWSNEGNLLNIDLRDFMGDSLDTDLAFYNSPHWENPELRNDKKSHWFRTFYGGIGSTNYVITASNADGSIPNDGIGLVVPRDYPARPHGVRPLVNISGDTPLYLVDFINGVAIYQVEYTEDTIESTGYEWSNDQPVINPPIIPEDTTAPSEVDNITSTTTESSVTLSWVNPTEDDFSHVNLYRDGHLEVSNITENTITIDGLREGTTYRFRITTVDIIGNESDGVSFTSTTVSVDRTPPNDVTNVSATYTDNSVTLSWILPTDSDFSHLRIYQNNSIIYDNFKETTVTIVSLPPNTTQKFKITSFDLNGNESNGYVISVTTSESVSPDDVRNLNATSNYDSITLYWDRSISTDYKGSNVYVLNNDMWTLIGDNIVDGKFTYGNLEPDTNYTLKVTALDIDGNESDGVQVSIKTKRLPDTTAPKEVTNLSETHTHNSVTLSWTNPTDEDFSYVKIYDGDKLIKDNVVGTSTTINGLHNSYEYTFTIKTVDNSGNISNGINITFTTNDSPNGIYYTIGDLPVGSKIRMGKVLFPNGEERIDWTIISKNHYKKDKAYPKNGVTLISDRNIKYAPFDTSGSWYFARSEIAYWFQSEVTGFLKNFSTAEKNAMIPTLFKIDRQSRTDTNIGGIVAKVALPSSSELHDTLQNDKNGVLFDYFTDNIDFKYVGSTPLSFENAKGIKGNIDTPQHYWLRDFKNTDALWGDSPDIKYNGIDDSQRVFYTDSGKENYGIRPITNINSSTQIELVEGETDVYQIVGAENLPPKMLPIIDDSREESYKSNTCLIHVIDPDTLSIEGVVSDYESASMTVNYNTLGDFIIIIDNRLDNAKLFTKEKYVTFNSDGKFAGIITNITIELDDDGNEIRTVKGKTLGHILSYRVIAMDDDNKPYDSFSGVGERAIKYFVRKNTNYSPTERINRGFPNFHVAEDKNLGQLLDVRYYYENLLDVVEEISKLQDLGYEISYDYKSNSIIFDVYVGKDLTINQSDNSPIVLSANNGNIKGQSYIYDEHQDKNFAYVNRNDKDVYNANDPQVIKIPKNNVLQSGIKRKETFYKIDSGEKGYYVPSNILGEERLNSENPLETFEVDVTDNQMYIYGVDYKLGDIVTVSNEDWSVSKDLRIVSVTLSMSTGTDYEISLTFGDVLPTLTQKINETVKKYNPDKHKKDW